MGRKPTIARRWEADMTVIRSLAVGGPAMLIERFLTALLFLLAGAIIVFDVGGPYFAILCSAGIALGIWVAVRTWKRR